MSSSERKKDQVISYLTLRMLIGGLGMSLPFLLVISNGLVNNTWRLEPSISDYYDIGTAGALFVGVLFVLGFFLLSYKGYERIDSIASRLGFVFALGVALCPNSSPCKIVHYMHYISAFLLFSTFIFFALYLFRKSDKAGIMTAQKRSRNKVYITCGIIMITCILGIVYGVFLASEAVQKSYHLVFWFETVALLAFGFSWIVKGELLLKDAGVKTEKGYEP